MTLSLKPCFANEAIDIELVEIEKLENQFDDFLKAKTNSNDYKSSIQQQLNLMFNLDQKIRAYGMHKDYFAKPKSMPDSYIKMLRQIDSKNIKELKKILEKENWITISKFGKETDNHAWILVQHSDEDPIFQKDILTRLEKLCSCGETDVRHFAYLYDRVAKSEGRPQRYGTQGQINEAGKWEAFDIEDIKNLNQRRASIKLGSFEDYQKLINQQFNH